MSRGAAGSSVLEALWVTSMMSVGILGLAALTGGLVRGGQRSETLAAASAAAEAEIERLVAAGPFDPEGGLAPGPHPADAAGEPRYQALDRFGAVVAPAVAIGSGAGTLLRRSEVSDATTTRCLRRVRVAVADAATGSEITAIESYVNCS
jgi:hypothetical protein